VRYRIIVDWNRGRLVNKRVRRRRGSKEKWCLPLYPSVVGDLLHPRILFTSFLLVIVEIFEGWGIVVGRVLYGLLSWDCDSFSDLGFKCVGVLKIVWEESGLFRVSC
jgi:hypothetical protein